MIDHFKLVQTLTDGPLGTIPHLDDFAFELGWKPSDHLSLPSTRDFATAHLIVEHGLDYTAVLSFLQRPYRFVDLTPAQQRLLASASYNSLIDWHISVDYDDVTFLYNRYRPPDFHLVRRPLSRTDISILQSSKFHDVTRRHPAPDVLSLDLAVVQTISIWKRQIGGDIPGVSNSALSALFNAILFVRAAEDHSISLDAPSSDVAHGLLVTIAKHLADRNSLTVERAIVQAIERLPIRNNGAVSLVELPLLPQFDRLDPALVIELFDDFYRNKFSPYYEYDFSLISRHALSKIYEHYVSMLRIPSIEQMSFLPVLAEETIEWKLGNVYTPEFIARFFARYIRARLPLRAFQRLVAIDPSCGSGIFLRALLELQNEALFDRHTTESIRQTFANVTGIDYDKNACHAAQLSLSLLSLSLIGEFPRDLRILNEEALQYYLDNPTFRNVADVVVANPPYIKFEAQSPEIQQRVLEVLGPFGSGRPDIYLAMLKMGLDLLKPGGYGLFVLPEAFLKSNFAIGIRELIGAQAWVTCVADLTAVRVFENVGVYTILLIFQKRAAELGPAPTAKILRCQERIAQALQDVIDDRTVESPFYTIHETTQEAFSGGAWSLARPEISLILRKYAELTELGSECEVRQGINTGADDIFILPRKAIPEDSKELFLPLLSDREMEAYTVPRSVSGYVFYPYVGKELISESSLKKDYSQMWEYLSEHRQQLNKRSAVKAGTIPWWRPERPRKPRYLLRPKIVTPHIVISPRFGFDVQGRYAISRAPMIFSPAEGAAERDHLCFLLGILNSNACFWHITQKSHVYDRGYSRLEGPTLSAVRVPAFKSVDATIARKIVRLVEIRIEATGTVALNREDEIDELVADLYGLDARERKIVGMVGREDAV
jgi:hypothetical protein